MDKNETHHQINTVAAQNMEAVGDCSVSLVVTSPPYPMVEIWDEFFCKQNPQIRAAVEKLNGNRMFELMHQELNKGVAGS